MKNNIGIETFLEQLGSEAPTPGGGAAAALTSSLGASLILMVTNNTIAKGKCGDYEELNVTSRDTATEIRARLTDCIEKDAEAYAEVAAAYRLARSLDRVKSLDRIKEVINNTTADIDKEFHLKRLEYLESVCGDPFDVSGLSSEMFDLLNTGYKDTRRVLLAAVSTIACEVPLSVMKDSLAALHLVEDLIGKSYKPLESDLRTSARCLHSGILSSRSLVAANLSAVASESADRARNLRLSADSIVEESTDLVHALFAQPDGE